MTTPTLTSANELQLAYNHFNQTLFSGQLPQCLITLQRLRNCMGYFSHQRFTSPTGITDEIALNPQFFATHALQETLQTLVHEMTHLWQFHFGTPSQRPYHNTQWANKMESIGLMPSTTGKPGGARTGQHMSDYGIENGPFLAECKTLIQSKFCISFQDRFAKPPKNSPNTTNTQTPNHTAAGLANTNPHPLTTEPPSRATDRTKFQCPSCHLNAWAKPSAIILCGTCQQIPMSPITC